MNWINFLINLLILFNFIKFIKLNKINNLNGQQINNLNKTELTNQTTFNQLNEQTEDKSKLVYKLDNQLDNQLNSQLNQIKVNCDQNYLNNCLINSTKLINLENDKNRIQNKNFKIMPIDLKKFIKPNSTTINKPLNDNLYFLPHSRPESELLELNRTTIFDNKNRSFINELEKRNQQQLNVFQPITITWNKINQFNKQTITTKCIPKDIPNSTFKLRYNGRSVRYYCNENYNLLGNSRLYCIQGRWTNEFPICKPTNGTNDLT